MRHSGGMAYGPGYAYPPADPSPPPPPPPGFPARRRAPLGVHLVAVLLYLTGLTLLFAATGTVLLHYGDGRVAGNELPASTQEWISGFGLPIAALSAVVGLFALLLGRRVHRGRQWARIAVLGFSALSLVTNGYMLVTTGMADPLTGLVLPVLNLVLLNTGAARGYFRGYQ